MGNEWMGSRRGRGRSNNRRRVRVNRNNNNNNNNGWQDAGLFFQQVSRTQASVMLRDLKASKQETSRKGRYYTAYVLLEVDKGALRERELEELQKNDEIYQKLSGTKLIDEMKAEMNEYRKSKGK